MRLFLNQLWGELVRLMARKRTYIGFGAFVVIEVVLVLLFHHPAFKQWVQRIAESVGAGDAFGEVFSALTVGTLIMGWTVFLLGALYVALVAGDIVAKEAEDGIFRMVLSRPVSRFRVLAIKWLACVIYTFVLIGFIATTSVLVGVVLRGWGGQFLVFPMDVRGMRFVALYDWGEGLWVYAKGIFFLCLSMCVIASVGFFFSCWKIKPAAATILTMTVFSADFVLEKIPPLEGFRGYFLTSKLDSWVLVMAHHVQVPTMVKDYAVLAGVCASCFVSGWLIFQSRDFKT